MDELISSSSNPLVKQIRSLRQRKGRGKADLFLVEGIHHVGAVIEAGWEIETLLFSPDQLTSDYAHRLIDDVKSRNSVRCVAMTADIFSSLAEKENPQGIAAIVRQRHLSLEDISPKNCNIGVALVSPQDPGNVGTILRTMDGVGADALFMLDGGVDPYHPSCVRASMGSIFWKPFVQVSFILFYQWARSNGYCLVGTSAHAKTDFRDFRFGSMPTILLLGSEQKGLSQDQMKMCDLTLSMPMNGRVSSLNLAVAAGILLYSMVEK